MLRPEGCDSVFEIRIRGFFHVLDTFTEADVSGGSSFATSLSSEFAHSCMAGASCGLLEWLMAEDVARKSVDEGGRGR